MEKYFYTTGIFGVPEGIYSYGDFLEAVKNFSSYKNYHRDLTREEKKEIVKKLYENENSELLIDFLGLCPNGVGNLKSLQGVIEEADETDEGYTGNLTIGELGGFFELYNEVLSDFFREKAIEILDGLEVGESFSLNCVEQILRLEEDEREIKYYYFSFATQFHNNYKETKVGIAKAKSLNDLKKSLKKDKSIKDIINITEVSAEVAAMLSQVAENFFDTYY